MYVCHCQIQIDAVIKGCVNVSDPIPSTYQQLELAPQLESKRSRSQFEMFIEMMT